MGLVHDLNELKRGKSFGRIVMNNLLSKEMAFCHGRWLDVGGGAPSYLKYLPADCVRVNTDVKIGIDWTFLDAEKAFPFVAAEFEGVIALNMLYIVCDPAFTLGEIKRVMKPGATFIATFPFFFSENPEPHDYHRWTREGVEKILIDAGFCDIVITPVGGVGTSFAMTLMPGRGSKFIQFVAAPVVFVWDKFSIKQNKQAPCFWLAKARK
ncbi:MAG: methyltransferase domain-containing protein [Patescibacteria group bacterium]